MQLRHFIVNKTNEEHHEFATYFAGLCIILGLFLMANLPAAFYAQSLSATAISGISQMFVMGNPYLAFLLIMLPFVVGLGAFLFVVKTFHQSQVLRWVTSARNFRWHLLFKSILLFAVCLSVNEVVLYFNTGQIGHFSLQSTFWPLLAMGLILFPIQVLFEEFLFRSYILIGFSKATKKVWLGVAISAICFGAMHMANSEVGAFGTWQMFLVYTLFGAAFAAITVLSGGLELAVGMHLMNNLFAAYIKTFPSSSLPLPALFTTPDPDTNTVFLSEITTCAIIFIVYFIIFKLYKKTPITARAEKTL